jgi:ABC-type branched-subunit amino acid transport system substrate-binding protein
MTRRTTTAAALFVAFVAIAAVAAATATARTANTAAPLTSAHALVKCGKTVSIGVAFPITGPAASIGVDQLHWAQFFRSRWNATHKSLKINMIQGDTQLPNVAAATSVAQTFASNAKILGVVGPSGSQEVIGTTAIFKGAGLGFVSSSATKTTLTDGSRRGYFFRVVPTDAQQGPRIASYAVSKLKVKRVEIIDDQEAYSTGLAGDAAAYFQSHGATVVRDSVSQSASDFSALVSKIPSNVQAVYIPWQLAGKAQVFAQQMKEQGKNKILLSSDGTFAPGTYDPPLTAYNSFFPVSTTDPLVAAFKRSHGGQPEFFGAPSYVAMQVVATAVQKACKNGTASRAEVRGLIAKTRINKSLLGFPVHFTRNGALAAPGNFGIFRVTNGNYVRVG